MRLIEQANSMFWHWDSRLILLSTTTTTTTIVLAAIFPSLNEICHLYHQQLIPLRLQWAVNLAVNIIIIIIGIDTWVKCFSLSSWAPSKCEEKRLPDQSRRRRKWSKEFKLLVPVLAEWLAEMYTSTHPSNCMRWSLSTRRAQECSLTSPSIDLLLWLNSSDF